MLDVHKTRWRQSAAVQFIYSFPFLSEIFAIVWTAMCLIFQSGVQKYWWVNNNIVFYKALINLEVEEVLIFLFE